MGRIKNCIMCFTLLNIIISLKICVASPQHNYLKENGIYSSYENLVRKLDEKNYRLRNSLLQDHRKEGSTYNEVDDVDYYMDQRAVQRAWSRDRKKMHDDYMNTHYVKLATENMKLVLTTAKCEVPTRRCLNVNKMEFGKPKTYWPNCAIVHKCGHDSGCCKYPGHVCSPVESHNIDLYFFSVEDTDDKQTGRVERLTFENHTKCDCRPMPDNSILQIKTQECECPKDFSPIPSSLECRCDCDKKSSKTCRRIKKGKRSYHSKGCNGKCGVPACDFGEFKTSFGRCPRKNDKGKRRK
ncbi:UNVERIFIED_CONTAM: hypothetical protein RMT77_005895 [Armadillidium vulgare]